MKENLMDELNEILAYWAWENESKTHFLILFCFVNIIN